MHLLSWLLLFLTWRHIDGPGVFSQFVGDSAGDGQVHTGDHSDFMDGFAIWVGALLLETQ